LYLNPQRLYLNPQRSKALALDRRGGPLLVGNATGKQFNLIDPGLRDAVWLADLGHNLAPDRETVI
jgi:hypothetical protein